MRLAVISLLGRTVASRADGLTFDYETAQLTAQDVGNYSDIAPAAPDNGTTAVGSQSGPACRAFPGSADWPLDYDWKRLNASLGGALLKPLPRASVCYQGPAFDAAECTSVVNNQVLSTAIFEDPLMYTSTWPTGATCPVAANPTGTCTQGGLPLYVVNATSVKQIQIAVNFARKRNLRLVVKNTGHDFLGRSTGAGALSIWTHHLKGFEVLPNFSVGNYSGAAAHVGSGLMGYEVHEAMAQHNIALVAPSFGTVGTYGGYMAGGGHSSLGSLYGLASDQALSLNVVTAGGEFTTASPTVNSDLFYALRGGGGSTYGIVTSAVVKTYPPVSIGGLGIAFSSLDVGIEAFWKAISVFFSFGGVIVDAGGKEGNYVSPLGTGNATFFNFTSTLEFPGLGPQAVTDLLKPLELAFQAGGVNITFGQPTTTQWSGVNFGSGVALTDVMFTSRLIPRAVWDDPAKFAPAMAAMRKIAEAGYQLHGSTVSPSLRVAGYPGSDSGVNPAWRKTVMHCVIYDFAPHGAGVPPADDLAARARLSRYTDLLRGVTPGSGAYINEADILEPNWQQSFFGDNYARLVGIKDKWDPWGLFWAPNTPGSERLTVRVADGLPTQNGKLCRPCVKRKRSATS